MKNRTYYILASLIVLLIAVLVSLCVGRYNISVYDVLSSLSGQGIDSINLVVHNLRLPRITGAVLIGAALAASGIAYQGLFQNPLVSPDILGVSSGACVGAVTSILLGLSASFTMLFAFATGLVSVAVAILLAILTKNSKNSVMVFSGIIVGRFMSSIVGMLIFFSDDESQLGAIVEWQMGSFAKVTMDDLTYFGPLLIVCIALLLLMRWRIN